MKEKFAQALFKTKGSRIVKIESAMPQDPSELVTTLHFSDGTMLSTRYWRLLCDGRPLISSFDHTQNYKLKTPTHAPEELMAELNEKTLWIASCDEETGDLTLTFEGDMKLEIFNFSANEVWEIRFADGFKEFSNYVLD